VPIAACDDLLVSKPMDDLDLLQTSTASLLGELDEAGWTDADLAAPSLCAGWTRAHVLSHVARNADSISTTLEGALRNEIVARYPYGWDARNKDIDDGAARPAAELLADVIQSARRLDSAFAAIDASDAWERPSDKGRQTREWVWWRLREVEIHHVDLAGRYLAREWPAALLAREIPESLAALDERIEGPVRVEIESASVRELDGLAWTGGRSADSPTVVRGPDWAVLAWLIGRPSAAGDALTALPPLKPWK
jgi:maleylpyruvate isomerase